VVHGCAGRAIPHNGGLALVRDADSHDVVARDVGGREGLADGLAGVVPDLLGIMFDPSRPGENLRVLELARCDHRAAVIEDDGAGAGRSLVDGDYIVGRA
jgi:hypothetical protein